MLNHLYFTFLLLLPLFFLLYKGKKFFLRHAYVSSLAWTQTKRSFKVNYKVLNWIAFSLLSLAAIDFVWFTFETKETFLVHKYILVNDASGSMVDMMKKGGIGKDLQAVIDGNKKFLSMIKDSGKEDYVGAIVFSSDAFVVSDLVDDTDFVLKKILRIDYNAQPLALGTDINAAIWSAILLALGDKRNDDLETRMYGSERDILQDGFISEVLNKKRKEAEGTSVIIFTDGIFFGADGSDFDMSAHKLLDFCKLIGIRVYLISVFRLDTGFNDAIEGTGGEVLVINQVDSLKLERVYEDILNSQANEMTKTTEEVDKSVSQILASAALILLIIGMVLQNTINRNFTEV